MVFDLKLATIADAGNPTVGDLQLDNGDLVWVDNNVDRIVQQSSIRLKSFMGDWFLNLREGVPWFQDVLKKNPNTGKVRAIIRQTLLGIPGVAKVPSIVLELDKQTRNLTISWELTMDDGRRISSEDFGPFVLVLGA